MKSVCLSARKRGADMTQALLYAAFAIIVLISVLAMYGVVQRQNAKTEFSRLVTMVSEEARFLGKNKTSGYVTAQDVANISGLNVMDGVRGSFAGGPVIATPMGGQMELWAENQIVEGEAVRFSHFKVGIYFPMFNKATASFCNMLGTNAERNKDISGILGNDYFVSEQNCDHTKPSIIVFEYRL